MNIFDINNQDPKKFYRKIIDERKCNGFFEWLKKVDAQKEKLEKGVFVHGGKLYTARFQEINQSEYLDDEVSNCVTTICRKVLFKWHYVELKAE